MKKWNELTMSERAEAIRVAVKNGITDLGSIRDKYNEFAEGGGLDSIPDNWSVEEESRYIAWRNSLPANLRNSNDSDYDMRRAFRVGMQPSLEDDGRYHLGSRDPQTGRILKAPHHPTYLQAINTDARMGYYPIVDKQGVTYTNTWRGNESIIPLLNEYAQGGSIHIKPSKRGTFTAAATKHGKSVQEFASQVLAHKENYSSAMVKKANFARNASKWKHGDGGNMLGGGGLFSLLPSINLVQIGTEVASIPTNKAEIRKRLYNNINPYEYDNAIGRAYNAVARNKRESALADGLYLPEIDNLWAEYLQIPQNQRHKKEQLVNEGHVTRLLPATYKPTKGNSNSKYYKLNLNEKSRKAIVDDAMGNAYEEGINVKPYSNNLELLQIKKTPIEIGKNRVTTSYDKTLNWALRDFTIGRGRDQKGEYVSYYDLWDLSPYRISNKDQSFGIGKPFEIYDRIYLDDYYGIPKESRGGNYLPEIVITGKKRKKAFGGNLFEIRSL